MKQRNSMFRALFVFLVSLALITGVSGCDKKQESQSQKAVAKKTAPKPEEISPLPNENDAKAPETEPLEPTYNPEGKRDPFATPKGEIIDIPSEEEFSLLPLTRHELTELKMVGVIWGGKLTKALIEDPAGTGYAIGVGERIGNSGGVVTQITETEVVVREEFRGVGDRLVTRESSLQLITAGGK